MSKRLLPAVIAAALLWPDSGHAVSYMLGRPVHVGTGGADAVVVADFDGDGRDDLATAVQGDLEVILQNPDGTLAPARRFDFAGTRINVVQKADLGADGSMQILAGHNLGLAVYSWDGAGGFRKDDYPSIPCLNIATSDLDGDGAPDVLCLGRDANAMLYYSAPQAILAAPVPMQTAAMDSGALGDVLLEDISGDGKPDLLVSTLASNSFFVYRHDGERSFLPAVGYTYPNEHGGSQAIAVLDVDQDGVKEVVVAAPSNRPRSLLYIYRRAANGYLELSKTMQTFDIPAAFKVSDLDADGDADLLVGHDGWQTLGRYMGLPKGLSAAELWSSVAIQNGSRGLAVGDLDGNGYTDVGVANSFGVSLLYGGRPVPSDINADFASDLIWRNATGTTHVWRSANSATVHALTPRDSTWSNQATGDFDGDGEADLFWRNLISGYNDILSAGIARIAPPSLVASQDWQVEGAGDFDSDGRSDLLWRNHATGANSIWRSGDAALFQATASVSDLDWQVAGVGDFDGDGRSDIFWRHATTGRNEIWRRGRADLRVLATSVTDVRWRVAGTGDFNGDGRDDLVWRNSATGANTIWLGANSATQQPVAGVTDLAWTLAAVGDYNGDARADLMWRNAGTGANVIWRSADSRQKQTVASITDWTLIR